MEFTSRNNENFHSYILTSKSLFKDESPIPKRSMFIFQSIIVTSGFIIFYFAVFLSCKLAAVTEFDQVDNLQNSKWRKNIEDG